MPPPADDVCEVIITAPDPDWLVEFTRRLVTDRLCASGHNFAPIRTIYRWRGQVHDRGPRCLRTRRSLLPQIVDRAKREHPYEVPSVVAAPDHRRWPRLPRLDPGTDPTACLR
jgi:periplasmic divalent cation tolerance protein